MKKCNDDIEDDECEAERLEEVEKVECIQVAELKFIVKVKV